MPIMFQTLLTDAGLDLGAVRLLRHQPKGVKDPFTLWRTNHDAFERYQSIQFARSQASFAWANWAAFTAVDGGRTLFLGLYRTWRIGPVAAGTVDPLGGHEMNPALYDQYGSELLPNLAEYQGKLFIDWGPSYRAWNQRADKKPKPITELYDAYREPEFPGHLKVIKQMSEVPNLPSSWVTALRNAKGVYLLTCPSTGEQYVGKADGLDGFWGRWSTYVATGDGGNVRLKSREPSDYQVSILEVAGSAATVAEIDEMERRWKSKLRTKEMGLNGN